MKCMPIVAAVLDFMSAAFQLLIAIVAFMGLIFGRHDGLTVGYALAFAVFTIPFVSTSLLAGWGGCYALKRRHWGLALAGATAAFLPLAPLWVFISSVGHPQWSLIALPGVAAIVLTALSKKRFK